MSDIDWKTPCWNVVAPPGGPGACVLTWCCPCITYGINLSKLGSAPQSANVFCAGQFTPACCLYCAAATVGLPCLIHIPTRQYIRTKYNIKEPAHGGLEDFLCTWCCSCCVIIQEYNEIVGHDGDKAGSVFSDLKKAGDTAAEDAKKGVGAAKDAVKSDKKEEKKEEEKKEEKAEKPVKD